MRVPLPTVVLSAILLAPAALLAAPEPVQIIERENGRVEAVIVPVTQPPAGRRSDGVAAQPPEESETAPAVDDDGRRWWKFWRWLG